jgi:hypothetical protein
VSVDDRRISEPVLEAEGNSSAGQGAINDDILGYAAAVLHEFEATREWSPGPQLRAATRQAAQEYSGRFLLELLQNAHDQHDRHRHDGRISVVVDVEDGDHGVAYVANGGAPFTSKDFRSLCKLAASGKVFGAGIGYKGVGFRSVLGVCEWPEIFSADLSLPRGNLGGYSFRFATYDDLLFLAGGDADVARRVRDEMPQFQIPMPAGPAPERARELAADGHVTVVRVRFDTAEGREAAMARMREMGSGEVPVLLFLERIASLRLSFRSGGAIRERFLTRHESDIAGCESVGGGPRIRRVGLDNFGDFVVSSIAVDPNRLADAVAAVPPQGQVAVDWSDWKDAVVSIAVPVEGDSPGRMFAFLPMGDKSPSPFAGHLNAPFITTLNRTAIEESHPLNSMLLDVAAELTLATCVALRDSGLEDARRWVSDLLCWRQPYSDRLQEAARRVHHVDLADLDLVPLEALQSGRRWGSCVTAPAGRWPTPRC